MKNFNSFTDEQLIRMYLTGNANAFDALVIRHKGKIYTSILLMVKYPQTADDIFQEVFIRIIKSLKKGSYKENGKFLSWAICVAHNMCIDYFRKQKNSRLFSAGDTYDEYNLAGTDESSAENGITGREIREKILQILDRLPAEQREIVILRHYADMSFKEIAALTSCSINTALGRMRYALQNLRRYAGELAEV